MADKFDEDFKNWLKDSKSIADKDITTLETDASKKAELEALKKEFKAFQVYLEYYNKTYSEHKNGPRNDKQDTEKHFDGIKNDLIGKTEDEQKAFLANNYPPLGARQGQTGSGNTRDNLWIQEKIKHWNNEWCQKPDKDYKFDPIETDIRLKFDIYKTEADKAAGKKAVTVEYNSERDVSLSTEDGKAPDFEFFDKMVQEAKEKDHVPGVTFEGEMSPDFKAKLAIACIKYGLPMTGYSVENQAELFNGLPEEDKAAIQSNKELMRTIDNHFKKKDYRKIFDNAKEAAETYKTSDTNKNPDGSYKPYQLPDNLDDAHKAIVFAAYELAGITVEGVNNDDYLKRDLNMPKEAFDKITDHNKAAYQVRYKTLEDNVLANQEKEEEEELKKLGITMVSDKKDPSKKIYKINEPDLNNEAEKEKAAMLYLILRKENANLIDPQTPLAISPWMPDRDRSLLKGKNEGIRNNQLASVKKKLDDISKGKTDSNHDNAQKRLKILRIQQKEAKFRTADEQQELKAYRDKKKQEPKNSPQQGMTSYTALMEKFKGNPR